MTVLIWLSGQLKGVPKCLTKGGDKADENDCKGLHMAFVPIIRLWHNEDADTGGHAQPGGVERRGQEECKVQEHARKTAAGVLQPTQQYQENVR